MTYSFHTSVKNFYNIFLKNNTVISCCVLFLVFLVYGFEVINLDGVAVNSKTLYATYLPFIFIGGFFYIKTLKCVANKLSNSKFLFFALLFWLFFGAWIFYLISLILSFSVIFLSMFSETINALPAGLFVNQMYRTAFFALFAFNMVGISIYKIID